MRTCGGHRSLNVHVRFARGDDDESSDYDFLAEFLPDTTLFDIAELELELQDLLGRNVDVAEASALPARSRSMLEDAIPL